MEPGNPPHHHRCASLGIAIGAALACLWLLPSAASAADCSIDNDTTPSDPTSNAPALLDSGGYEWDVSEETQPTPARSQNEDFATIFDGGSLTSTTPPGARSESDSYDGFGALFVGLGGDANVANFYFSANDDSCVREDGDRELVFPALPLNGLTVQRKLFVAATGMPGARLLQLFTNRGKKAVITQIQIGDTLSEDNYGDLGSDGDTVVRSSSDGNLVLSPADFWAVTSDHVGPVNSDLALAHVIDGPGGRQRIDFATQTGTSPLTGANNDNLAWRWDNLRLQPGQTVSLVSYLVQQGVASANAATEDANAATQAAAYQTAPPTTLFNAMTKSEQAAVANWATPVKCGGRAVTIAGSDARDKIVGTKKPDVIFAGAGNDKVKGKKGNDRICGGPGKDTLIGGAGARDLLKGGGGKDVEKQ